MGVLSTKGCRHPQQWGLLGFSCSPFPHGMKFLRGSFLELSCSWPGDRVTQVKCFLCFSMWPSSIFELSSFFSFFLVVQNFLWAILVVYLLFCWFWWGENVGNSWPSILQMSLPCLIYFQSFVFRSINILEAIPFGEILFFYHYVISLFVPDNLLYSKVYFDKLV